MRVNTCPETTWHSTFRRLKHQILFTGLTLVDRGKPERFEYVASAQARRFPFKKTLLSVFLATAIRILTASVMIAIAIVAFAGPPRLLEITTRHAYLYAISGTLYVLHSWTLYTMCTGFVGDGVLVRTVVRSREIQHTAHMQSVPLYYRYVLSFNVSCSLHVQYVQYVSYVY